MECPVCNTIGIRAEAKICPKCNSDLEGIQLFKHFKKCHKSRLTIAIVASVLFVIVLLAWILSFILTSVDSEVHQQDIIVEANSNPELFDIKAENENLKIEGEALNKKIKELEKEQLKKETTYVVKENETLFSIARIIYGNGFKYMDIAKDNQIEPPYIIQLGQKLTIYY